MEIDAGTRHCGSLVRQLPRRLERCAQRISPRPRRPTGRSNPRKLLCHRRITSVISMSERGIISTRLVIRGLAMTNAAVLSAVLAALASGLFALVGVVITSTLAQKREHTSDWRQVKMERYQEYIAALSAIVSGRSTPAAQERYADAVNALTLVASPAVLDAVQAFQREISYRNTERSDERHDALLSAAIWAMRTDVQPGTVHAPPRAFKLLAPPPPNEPTSSRS